ncbi:MAG TPA: asparaginase domain-containing protein [Caulobacterales bacterium]|nr:asparaginase domain-containing protein [Caulobacterales bacterium]
MRILVLSCGGTIVSPDDATGKANTKARGDAAQWLIEMLFPSGDDHFRNALKRRFDRFDSTHRSRWSPEMELFPDYVTDKDSTNVGPQEWRVIVDKIIDAYDKYHGFLLPHGTNSLAYTASALSFALPNLAKPVVMTGSNVPIGQPYSDGPMNAANAVFVLQKMLVDNLHGVFTVFANRMMPGVRTKKSSGVDLKAFTTFNAQDVGSISKDEVTIDFDQYRKYRPKEIKSPISEKCGEAADSGELAAHAHRDFNGIISSHTFHPGDDPMTYVSVLDSLARRRKEKKTDRGAMIIRAVGDGDVSDAVREVVFPHAKRLEIPVVVTTQEPQGVSSLKHNLVSDGAEEAYGIIPAHDMSIETMVVKLRYLLSNGLSYSEIHKEFLTNYLGEINVRTAKTN